MSRRLRRFVLATGALVFALCIAPASTAAVCGVHLGQSVEVPAGLPAGSFSIRFVPGGTVWQTPDGQQVTVPQTTFPPCGTTSTPSTPPPTSTPPTTTPTTPPVTPPPPPKAPTPPPATSTTPPPTQPPSTPPATTPPATPPTTPTPPPEPRTPRTPEQTTTRPPVAPPIDSGRSEEDRARRLIQPPAPPVFVPPTTPPDDGKTTDELIQRLGRELKEPPPTTQERPPARPPVPPTYSPPEPPPTYGPGEPPPPHRPEQPPPYRPEEPPPPHRPDDKTSPPCCGMTDNLITFPIVSDPMEIPKEPEAPHDTAVGAFQVLLHNGAFYVNELDVSAPAPALPIDWVRHWQGKNKYKDGGIIGYGWDFSYNRRIVPLGQPYKEGLQKEQPGVDVPKLVYYNGSGRAEVYIGTHSEEREVFNFDKRFRAYVTTYLSPPGQFHEIERYVVLPPSAHPFVDHPDKEGNIFFVLREKNGVRYVFNCRGQLILILSRHDNNADPSKRVRVTLRYTGPINPLTQSKMLSRIVDPVGRVYEVGTTGIHDGEVFTNYDCKLLRGRFPIPRIKTVSGNGLSVEYVYHDTGEGPVIEAAIVSYPGLSQRYEYSYDGANRITSIKDPNETAKGSAARAYITNKYDGDGRVMDQQLGDIPFSLKYSGSGCTVTDANGTDRVYALEKAGGFPVVAESKVKAWTTKYAHNPDTQVTRITYPRGNGVAYEYTPGNQSVTLGPIRDWTEKNYTYENDLERGNLVWIKRFGLKSDESLISTQSYEHLYNQPHEIVDVGDAKVVFAYRYDEHGERGEPVEIRRPSVRQPDGSEIARPPAIYSYDFRGEHTSIDLGGSRVTSYTFNPGTGFLDRVDRADGSYSTYKHDDRGNVIEEEGTRAKVITRRDGRGLIVEHIVDPDGDAVTTTFKYNEDGNPVETRVRVEDVFARPRTVWSGRADSMHKPEPIQPTYERVVKTEYNILNRVTSVTTTGGRDSTYVKYEYAPDGTIERQRRAALNGTDEYVVEYKYDPRGLVTDIISAPYTDSELHKEMRYDANGNETDVREAAGAQPVHKVYDGLDGLVETHYASGAVHRFEYDPRGHVKHQTVEGPPGPGNQKNVLLYRADFDFDAYGNMIRRRIDPLKGGEIVQEWTYDPNVRLKSIKSPTDGITSFEYDLGDRVTLVTDPLKNEVENVYDKAGYLKKTIRRVSEAHADATTARISETRATHSIESAYDKLGRVVAIYGANDELKQQYLYNSEGNLRATFTPGAGQVEYLYDGLGRQQAVRRGDGFELSAYTPGGLVSEFDNGVNHVRKYYDAQGRIVREEDVNEHAESTSTYDEAGRVKQTVDRNGTVVEHIYDKVGLRHEVRVSPSGLGAVSEDGFTPAVSGAQVEVFEMDALARVVRAYNEQEVEVELHYDGAGRVVTETQKFKDLADSVVRSFAPDLSSRELTYPAVAGASTLRSDYDVLGRTTRLTLDRQPVATYAYASPDRLVSRVTGNGYRTRYDHDDRERLTRVSADAPIEGRFAPLWSHTANYGRGDRLESTVEEWTPLANRPGQTVQSSFSYDARGRVVGTVTRGTTLSPPGAGAPLSDASQFSETGTLFRYRGNYDLAGVLEWGGGGTETSVSAVRRDAYTYDARGRVQDVTTAGRSNMVGKTVPTGDYEKLDAFVSDLSDTIVDKQTFKYDRMGHVLADGRFLYSYDYRGRLVRVVDRWFPYGYNEAVFFYYDPLGRRVASVPWRDRDPQGLLKWGPDWNKPAQWYLYDGSRVIADVWMNAPKEADGKRARVTPGPRLLARYVYGALPGERVRVDRRAEDAPAEDLRTFYLHQDLDGRVRFVTDMFSFQPTQIANAEPAPGTAAATPGRPPNDALMVAGTQVRIPYVNGTTRVDGFAATSYREDFSETLYDYRSAWGYARKLDYDKLRSDRLAQQNSLQMDAGAFVGLLVAGPVMIEVGPSIGSLIARTGYVRSALQASLIKGTSAVIAGGAAAWLTSGSYSLGEATTDFVSNAAMGPLDAAVGGLGLGMMGQFAFDVAFNVGTGVGQSVLQGMDISDAINQNARQGVIDAVKGFVVSRVVGATSRGIAKMGEYAGQHFALSPAGAARPGGAAQRPPQEVRYVDAESVTVAQQQAGSAARVSAKGQLLKALDAGVLSAMEKDGAHARFIAHLIRTGELEIRYYRGAPKTRADGRLDRGSYRAYTYSSRLAPEHGSLYVNLEQFVRNPRRGTFNRYDVAQAVVHEAIHALGGSEIAAFIGQAKFMFETVVRRNATLEETGQWFGHDAALVDIYESFTGDARPFSEHIFADGRYTVEQIGLPSGTRQSEYVTRVGGWAKFFGVTDPSLDVLEQWARSAKY